MPEFEREPRELTFEEKKRQLEREQLARDYGKVFATREGRAVFKDIIAKCHVFQGTFHVTNGKLQDYMEGRRSIGLELIANCGLSELNGLKKLNENKRID